MQQQLGSNLHPGASSRGHPGQGMSIGVYGTRLGSPGPLSQEPHIPHVPSISPWEGTGCFTQGGPYECTTSSVLLFSVLVPPGSATPASLGCTRSGTPRSHLILMPTIQCTWDKGNHPQSSCLSQ